MDKRPGQEEKARVAGAVPGLEEASGTALPPLAGSAAVLAMQPFWAVHLLYPVLWAGATLLPVLSPDSQSRGHSLQSLP